MSLTLCKIIQKNGLKWWSETLIVKSVQRSFEKIQYVQFRRKYRTVPMFISNYQLVLDKIVEAW